MAFSKGAEGREREREKEMQVLAIDACGRLNKRTDKKTYDKLSVSTCEIQ